MPNTVLAMLSKTGKHPALWSSQASGKSGDVAIRSTSCRPAEGREDNNTGLKGGAKVKVGLETQAGSDNTLSRIWVLSRP